MKLKHSIAVGVLIAGVGIWPVLANVGYNPGSVIQIFDYATCQVGGVHCSAHVNINSSGTEIATSGNPMRVDPTGTTTQPTSPASPSAWGIGNTGSSVPAAANYFGMNIGGNLVGPTGLALGATTKAPTVAIVDGSGNQVTAFGGSGGTASNFGSAFPTPGTAAGFTDGTNMVAAKVRTPGNTATTSDAAVVVSDPTLQGIANQPIPACSAAPCLTTIGNAGSDPSSGVATPTMAFLSLPATATTQIIALSGSTKTYVTSRLVFGGGTVNVTFKYGTGTNCATGTTTLDGPYPVTAQTGFAEGNGVGAVMIVPSGQALCVTTDASVSGGVKLTYQQK
jgi:hypothetical protein